MSADVLLRVAIALGIGLPILIVLWRVFVMGGELRRDERYGRTAVDIARRAGLSLDELSAATDELRRGKGDPEATGATVGACTEALRRYSEEAAIVDKHVATTWGSGLQAEIDRAQRAVELIEHGRRLMLESGSDGVAEGETSIKRGYLNLLHARDAIRERAEAIAAATAAQSGSSGRS